MFEWMITHKKNIMKYTLYLVIPSFVLLYGYGQCAKPELQRWVAKVNGEEISDVVLDQWVDNIRNQMRAYGQDMPYSDIRNQALQTAILTALYRQKAQEWGVGTTDEELLDNIQGMKYFQDESGQFNLNYYRYALANAGYRSPVQFEAQQRDLLTRNKVQSVIRNMVFGASTEKDRFKNRQEQKAQVEYLAFEPSAYTQEVVPVTDEMKAFFEKNSEEYRIPDQRKIGYVQFYPSNYIQDVTYDERDVERYFNKNPQKYEIPEKVQVDYLLYSDATFADQANPSETDLQEYYSNNTGRFLFPEQVKVRFVKIALDPVVQAQSINSASIEEYYQKNLEQYKHEGQVKAKHLILRVTPEASESDTQAVKERILQIRQEIVDGLSFEEAAKKYSEDGTASQGGELGFKPKGYFDADFEAAAYELPLGQLSEPVKTRFGFHLVIVEERDGPGTTSLDQVKEVIEGNLKMNAALEVLKAKAASMASLVDVQKEYEVQNTDWFSRNDEIPGVESRDKFTFYFTATQESPNPVRFSGNPRMEFVYWIEPLDKTEPRSKTFDEAKDEVLEDVKLEQAKELAKAAAKADAARIQEASLTLEQIAEERGIKILTSEAFGQQDRFIPGIGRAPYDLVSAAFAAKVGETHGSYDVDNGSCIIRLLARDAAHLPEFVQVKDQVESDYRNEQSEKEARRAAATFSDSVVDRKGTLKQAAMEQGLEYVESEYFKEFETIPGLGFKRNLNAAAFDMEKINSISLEIEERVSQPGQQTEGPVEAYYVFELLDIKKTYIPTFEEALETVQHDYRLLLAESVAREQAQKTLDAIKAKIAAGEPFSPTCAVDLKSFAKEGEQNVSPEARYQEPFEINGLGSVTGLGRSIPFAKTALALQKGQVSGLVENFSKKRDQEGNPIPGQMTGVYIIQSLGPLVADDKEQETIDRFSAMIDTQIGNNAFSAWIDEVSAASVIEYNSSLAGHETAEETPEAEMTDASS